MTNKIPYSVGLALGGGAARGISHVGVIKALCEKGVSIKYIAGTSMGAILGAIYAKDKDLKQIEDLVLNLNWKKLATLIDPGFHFLREGLIHGDRIIETIHAILGDVEFKELAIPFACKATDIQTGHEVLLNEGKVIDALRASISLPGIFAPVKVDGRYLIDGGVVDPVPVRWVRHEYPAFVIAVDVTIDYWEVCVSKQISKEREKDVARVDNISYLDKINGKIEKFLEDNRTRLKPIIEMSEVLKNNIQKMVSRISDRPPPPIQVLLKTIFIMEHRLAEDCLKEADLVIRPQVGQIDLLEFYRAREAIDAGYKAVMEHFE